MRQVVETLGAIDHGDFSARLPSDWTGLEGKVADNLNSMSSRLERFNTSLVSLRRRGRPGGKGQCPARDG